MKCSILLLFFLLASAHLFAQQKTIILRESDNFNGTSWNWSRQVNDPIYNCYITDQQNYYLSLSNAWGFTFAGLPKEFQKIDEFSNGELNFDFKVSTMVDNSFSLGLLFDFHGETDQCKGGNFYNLRIHGDGKLATASIYQRKACEYLTHPTVSPTSAAKLDLVGYNHVSIKKKFERYETYVNGIMVLSFEFKGILNFRKLYWERGNYYLDNFTINEITYNSPQVILAQEPRATDDKTKPEIYVLAVGINAYDQPNLPNLFGCVNDATFMTNFWISTAGGAVNSKNVSLLTDKNATIENILKTADELFRKAKENDVIVTFFSGHGGLGVFYAYDGTLSYERVNQIISKSRAKKLCILDACKAGSWSATSVLGQKGDMTSREDALKLFYSRLESAGNGMNWLLACKPDELSSDGNPNGIFTKYILQGLHGKADYDNDNIITVGELTQFLKQQFKLYNYTNTNKMNPQFVGDGNTSIPMAVVYSKEK